MEQTISCKICGRPYVFMPYYAGDQSACPKCRTKARKNHKWIPTPKIPPLNIE
jgi:hypothetical protein